MNTSAQKPWIAAQNKALESGIKSLQHDELLNLISAPCRHSAGTNPVQLPADALK